MGKGWYSMFSRLTVYRYVNLYMSGYKLIETKISCKPLYNDRLKNFNISFNEKLINNIIRAKSKIFDYCLNNDFYYFVTLTVNKNHDRENLDWLIRTTSQIIRDLRKKYKTEFKYILIPELHKDGKSWHVHGLFSKDLSNDLYINNNGYFSWKSYDKIGFSSISIIKNYEACIKYIIKYIKKDFTSRCINERLYFCSHNLNKSKKINDFVFSNDIKFIDFDLRSDYCNILEMNQAEYDEFINKYSKEIYCKLM